MGLWDQESVKFKKSGEEVKSAVLLRIDELEGRLEVRNAELERIMSDRGLLRSYLVRDTENDYPHSSQMKQDLPSEEHQRISELCKRICLIENELKKLRLTHENLKDDQEFELGYEELSSLGFGGKGEINFA